MLFANLAEAMAEGRGKAQADTLRKTQNRDRGQSADANGADRDRSGRVAAQGRRRDGRAGEFIPSDGEIIEGVASVDESAITGESAPVIREAGGDRSAVTGGTRVLSDWIKVRVTSEPGQTFLDRMIALVEGAERQKTPNEIALNILLAGLTIVFLMAVVTLQPFAIYSNAPQSMFVLVSLLVCLIPTTIGGLLSAIGIAGMDRLIQHNVLAMSGRAVEAAGDVHTLLLDKTGTITLGNRQAAEFLPVAGGDRGRAGRRRATRVARRRDTRRTIDRRARQAEVRPSADANWRRTRRRSCLLPRRPACRASISTAGEIRKGAADSVVDLREVERRRDSDGAHDDRAADPAPAARRWSSPSGRRALGVIHLKDVVKGGMRERFAPCARWASRP